MGNGKVKHRSETRERYKMAVSSMYEVFVHELGDVYDAEHRLQEDRGERAGSASDGSLKNALQEDHEESQRRIQNIEKVFEKLGEEPERETCQATQGLISEAQSGINEAEGGAVRDLLINAATIKEELYKSAAYRSILNSVQSLENEDDSPMEGRDEISSLLQENLDHAEKAAKTAEENVPGLSDVAKKAGAFRKAQKPDEDEKKGLMDKLKGN
jgi:ferritin-like metal-binding protein YciE